MDRLPRGSSDLLQLQHHELAEKPGTNHVYIPASTINKRNPHTRLQNQSEHKYRQRRRSVVAHDGSGIVVVVQAVLGHRVPADAADVVDGVEVVERRGADEGTSRPQIVVLHRNPTPHPRHSTPAGQSPEPSPPTPALAPRAPATANKKKRRGGGISSRVAIIDVKEIRFLVRLGFDFCW